VRPSVSFGGRYDKDDKIGVNVSCSLASKGGGYTTIKAWLEPSDFLALAESMMKVDPDAARQAFASAIENPNAIHDERVRNARTVDNPLTD
jgi:hypothetical protein